MFQRIGGERKVYVQQPPKLLEVTVYHPQSIAILRINGSWRTGVDIRKNIRAVRPVFFDNLLQIRQQPHLQPLPGFAACIKDRILYHPIIPKMNDIHKRHAATIETEHKQIPRLLQPGMPPEIDRSNECYFLLAQSPFHRLPPANVQIGKRIVLANLHPLLACLVANRPCLLYTSPSPRDCS